MKKMIIFLLLAAMLLVAGCGAKAPEATEAPAVTEATIPATEAPTEPPTEAPTEPPTEPAPECVEAAVQADDTPAVLQTLRKGDVVDIVGEFDEDHYIVKTETAYALVEKQFLKLSGGEEFPVWTGYARKNAGIYEGYRMDTEPVQTLKVNTQVEVIWELKYVYMVQLEETTGFMHKDEVSTKKIKSGSSKGSGGADGGDISLEYGGVTNLAMIQQEGQITGQAEVVVDGAPVILGYFQRGDLAPVVAEEGFAPVWEGSHTVYIDGFYAYIPMHMVQMGDQEPYAEWSGYTAYKACVYDNHRLLGEGKQLKTNTSVTILWDGGSYLVVSVDGETGFMNKEQVSTKRYSTGGGGSSGGAWTPPVL